MRQRTALEWHYAEEADEWERLTQPSTPVTRRRWPRRVVWSGVLALGVLLSIGLGWLWQTAQAGLAAIERDIDAAVNADAWSERHETAAAVSLVQLSGETAVVEVQMPATAGLPVLQQTRVYRQTQAGWTRTTPSAALWGEARRLETAHFVFAYHALDEEAVIAAAAHLERLYPALYAAFFAAPLPSRKWVVQVDPSHAPGDFVLWRNRQEPLVVASPAAYLAPTNITPEALLTQSVLLVLLDDIEYQVALQAVLNPYQPGYDEYGMTSHNWPLGSGIGLWQVWAADLPLAQWREPVVQWVFDATPLAPDQPYVEPGFAAELCAMHGLWMATPLFLQLPFACDIQFEERAVIERWLWSRPRRSESSLPLTARYLTTGDSLLSTRAVALATAMEYAAATYGPERIPRLLETMHKHRRWETLVVDVFGVSAAEFEAGWAAYLATHYGITEIR